VPDDPDLLLTKATVLELERKTGDAEDVLKKIQLRWPEWGRAHLIRGIMQATHRNPEQALQSIQTAIALGERTSSAYYYLAAVSRSARPDDRDAAQRAIAEALRLDPTSLSGSAETNCGAPARGGVARSPG
jgi:Flp pilus assembly protein TadD